VLALAERADVDAAVAAARRAFDGSGGSGGFGAGTPADRVAMLERLAAVFDRRKGELEEAITFEMGSPAWVSRDAQVVIPEQHIRLGIEGLRSFDFVEDRGFSQVRREPIGVVALITPWNWPVATVFAKLVPALAMGCTVVLKPSEYSSYSAALVAELVDEAEFPPGVVNLVLGEGPTVGSMLSSHPDVDMVSITGSTRAGAAVAHDAADTIKRVHQELGGKSPNVVLESADLQKAVTDGVNGLMFNAGQSCSAPSRMLVPRSRMEEALALAAAACDAVTVGPPAENATIGPVVNSAQFERIQRHIRNGIDEGATLVAGGPDRPEGLDKGYYVRPTVFGDVTPEMSIAREEIFGPVLVILGYTDVEDAVRIANATEYGLAAYVQGDIDEARRVGARNPPGQVYLNSSGLDLIDFGVPFGGRKRSGNGREWGDLAFDSFVELVSYIGYHPDRIPRD
jgi:aldehyde dehydrogenase (NAD+)